MRLTILTFCLTILLMGTGRGEDAKPQISIQKTILALQIQAGPWTGSLKDHPDAAGFRHYFVSDGLRSVASDPAAADVVEAYLGFCLKQADPKTGLWDDVPDIRNRGTEVVDADDSNAALFILLATTFHRTKRGSAWWDSHSESVQRIADLVLIENQLPSGLVTVFSKRRVFREPDRTPLRLALQQSAYLMDSCEVYAALHALALVMRERADSDGPRYEAAAMRVAAGIRALFQEPASAFYILDEDKAAMPDFYPADTVKFYPHRMAQVFPQLFDVPLGDAEETRAMYEKAWGYANSKGDWNAADVADGSTEDFPVMIRGLVALQRGDRKSTQEFVDWYSRLVNEEKRDSCFMIHEMGAALRIEQELKHRRSPHKHR